MNDRTSLLTEHSRRATTPIQNPPASFDALFLQHWNQVYRVLVRLVGDRAEAEDLALETFWRLYQQPPTDMRPVNLGGWLYRVAMNLGLNAIRAHKRRDKYEQAAGKWELENHIPDALDNITAEEERASVRRVLGEMDARQAQILLLRHSGMAYKEIAATIGVSTNSVGTLLVRAEREFEKRYREKGE